MHKLSILDASFLYFESEHMPMNIGAVEHFEIPPERRDTFYEDLLQYMQHVVERVPFMKEKLKHTPLGMDQPVWVSDPDFTLENHVQKLKLSAPGTTQQLETLVAELHEKPLDRARPLWMYYWIDGLESESEGSAGAGVLYSKYHHACMDGMAAQLILNTTLSPSPERLTPQAQHPSTAESPAPENLALLRDAANNLMRKPLGSNHPLKEQLNSALKLSRRILKGKSGLGAFAVTAPRTPFNRAISSKRTWAGCSLPLDIMKEVGRTQKASVNDVLMTVVAGALRRYLIREGALPGRTLTAGVPVSLRATGDSSMSNHVTMLLCALGTQEKHPLKRMQLIRESMLTGKDLLDDVSGLMLEDAHIPGLPNLLKNTAVMYDRLKLADFFGPVMNVVISNVRGPSVPMFLDGARMLSHYPVSIPGHSVAVNFTVQSYLDRLDMGITACAKVLPNIDTLRQDILRSWQELFTIWQQEEPGSPSESRQSLAQKV